MFDGVSGRMPDLFGKKRRTSSDNQQPVRSQLQKKSENIKTWWRQKLHKTNFDDDSSSSNTTLDWRSLSPDRPPLPFFLPSNESTNDTHQTTLIPQVPIESQPRYNNKVSALFFFF
jgi:hypothetical protein